jgi:hypothetical protein
MAVRAHSRGIKLIGATLTPFGNETFMADAWNPTREKRRVTVNKWIRESGAFDGVADFDAALRDPEIPTQMRAVDDCGDGLHPATAGTARWYIIALISFGKSIKTYPIRVCLPLVLQSLLPTIRTSVAIIFGAALVSELLGSQIGLGYLIQTSRTTYAMHVVFLVTIVLGLLATLLDLTLVLAWRACIFWIPKHRNNLKSV